jgi:hypothetical protein
MDSVTAENKRIIEVAFLLRVLPLLVAACASRCFSLISPEQQRTILTADVRLRHNDSFTKLPVSKRVAQPEGGIIKIKGFTSNLKQKIL